MHYLSTRAQAPGLSLSKALAQGLAPDGGLYVPAHLPMFTVEDFDGCERLPEVAERLAAFFTARDSG